MKPVEQLKTYFKQGDGLEQLVTNAKTKELKKVKIFAGINHFSYICRKLKRMELPELNKIYNYFDDGKIRESRRMEVLITEIIPFEKIDKTTLDQWEEEASDCYWLYNPETDYFVKGELLDEDLRNDDQHKVVFVRTIDDGWFSLGWWAGRLDVDGSLNDLLN